MSDEQRKAGRRRTLKGARIVFNRGRSVINCVVRNLSSTGALLRVDSPLGIPDEFVLTLDDGPSSVCHVARRTGNEIGVEFVREGSAHRRDVLALHH